MAEASRQSGLFSARSIQSPQRGSGTGGSAPCKEDDRAAWHSIILWKNES